MASLQLLDQPKAGRSLESRPQHHYETAAAMFKERIRLVPETDTSRSSLASALGHLGELEEARRIWAELKKINPRYSFAERMARVPFRNPADVGKIAEGLAKAGLPD